MNAIKEVLQTIDKQEDSLWTEDGAVRVEVVSDLLGHKVTRNQIIEADPKFCRYQVDELEEEEEDIQPLQEPMDEGVGAEPSVDDEPEEEDEESPLSEHEEILANIEKTEFRILELSEQEKALKEKSLRAKMSLKSLKKSLHIKFPDKDNSSAIRDHIASSNKRALEKSKKQKDLFALLGKSSVSPLDSSFARRTTRGTKRPGVHD